MDFHPQPFPLYEPWGENSTISIWKHTVELSSTPSPHYAPLQDKITADVAIVGAGITGLTAGLLLQRAGYSVVILDAHTLGYGVTGFNSGHLTSMLLDSDIRQVMANFGEEATRTISLELQKSIDFIERLVLEEHMSCELKRCPGYLYAGSAEQMEALREIEKAVRTAGLDVHPLEKAPLPFPTKMALRVENQGRFHPLQYVQGLAGLFVEAGGAIFENSRVVEVRNGGTQAPQCIETEGGQVLADEVLIATHTPIGFRPSIQSRMEVFRSYIIGIRTSDPGDDALFWDMDQPYHYIRQAWDEYGRLLVIGGEDHRSGEKREPDECFGKLEAYAREKFRVESTDYRWSAQFYQPADGLPYIGKLAGTYIATGYSGEGLTFGTLAGQIIADQLQGRENACGEILSPYRAKPIASAGGFIAENISAISHFVKDRVNRAEVVMQPEALSAQNIPPGEGRICDIGGKKVAVYHSLEGVMHFLSPVCTHAMCLVGWNPTEKSWDCPCHGGRFSATGKVLNGPPVTDLEHLDL